VLALLLCMPSLAVAQDTLEQVRFNVERFEVTGDNPIGEHADSILAPYVGEQFGLEGLSSARAALEQAIITAGFNFHRVSLPPQILTAGTVQLKVSRFVIGQVEIEGNDFFDDENIRHSVPGLQSGETPNTQHLSRSLRIANEHASKSTVLRFKEGVEADSIDAVLAVEDRDPQVFFISLDNSGPGDFEVWRSTFGYQNGNLFNTDQAITATYTTAPEDPSAVKQLGINYNLPLYEHGAIINMLFSISDTAGQTGSGNDGGLAPGAGGGQALEFTGGGRVYGFYYRRPLLTDSSYTHEWALGLQHKNFDNESEFDSEQISGADVISVPMELGYTFNRQAPGSAFFGNLSLVQEIGDDDSEYDDDRPEAEAGWTAIRYSVVYDQLFAGEYLFHAKFAGQYTDALLISGEQFGVGGEYTLRGFEERSVTGDAGYYLNLEVWLPPFEATNLRFLVFADLAHTEYNDGDIPGNDGIDFDPRSTGLGMYWAWKESISASLIYGYILEGGGLDTTQNEDGDSKLHARAVFRF